ncbi:MAG: cytochrome c oxidase subunit II [Comamonadaceae bacterium]|nr:MAG: cytochrome c oxidase subunit II [Comamonadaceae bacterium]
MPHFTSSTQAAPRRQGAKIRRRSSHLFTVAAAVATTGLLAGCGAGPLSVLDPAGPGAAGIAQVWWVMFWFSAAVVIGMTGLALYATLRDPERRLAVAPRSLLIGGGLVFPVVVLSALLIYGVRAGHSLLPLPTAAAVFSVDVTAHQWWWEVSYPDAAGGMRHAANEIHIPAGRPVDIRVRSSDVIHGFWIPRLGGKIDAIPGRVNTIRVEADKPGVYQGQCAEFCGLGHAHMKLLVQAHDEAGLQGKLAGLSTAPLSSPPNDGSNKATP